MCGGGGGFFGILRLKSSYLYLFGIQIALAWGIKRNTPVLPKAVSENHIKENLEALHVNLDEDDMKAIENIGIRHRYLMQAWMFKPEEVPENYWDGEEWLNNNLRIASWVKFIAQHAIIVRVFFNFRAAINFCVFFLIYWKENLRFCQSTSRAWKKYISYFNLSS